jgi:hypothetical protein
VVSTAQALVMVEAGAREVSEDEIAGAIEFAHGRGVRYLRTFNDSVNTPIWAINERMGFRRTVEWSDLERRFAPKEATSLPPTIR